jgi:hypothetical protein
MRREGTLHIVWTNRHEHAKPKYNVTFADYGPSYEMKSKEIVGEDALRDYLTAEIMMHSMAVNSAMQRLRIDGHAEIFHTTLTDEQLTKMGLK